MSTNPSSEDYEMFCVKEVFKCHERGWYEKIKEGQKIKLGDATPRNIQEVSSVKAWGCPRHPLLHQQNYQVVSIETTFLLIHILCAILGASFCFSFSFAFFFAGH